MAKPNKYQPLQLETVALPTADKSKQVFTKTEDELAAETHVRIWAGILGNDKPRT